MYSNRCNPSPLYSLPRYGGQGRPVPEIKRTYLIGYLCSGGGGRFFHDRETDDAPTREQVVSMEAKLDAEHGKPCAITTIFLLQNSEVPA